MSTPHETWASLYDTVYEKGYGPFYRWMTRITLKQILNAVTPPARIVDFGAGTGRISLLLAEGGYNVTAVDPSRGMLVRLKDKAKAQGLSIQTVHGRIEDFRPEPAYDLAICIFTVLLYILDEGALQRSFQAAAGCLKPGGLFLLDVPRREMFTSGVVRGEGVKRSIEITPRGGEVYKYIENTTVEVQGSTERFKETFPIRYWPPELVLEHLAHAGFTLETDLSALLKRSGSDYFLMRKTAT